MVCSYDPSSISSCMLGYCCLQLLLLSTNNLVHQFSFFQEQECWHSINCPLLSNSLQFININLEEGDIGQLFSNLCQNWGNETARATPRSGEINYNLSMWLLFSTLNLFKIKWWKIKNFKESQIIPKRLQYSITRVKTQN